MPTSSHSTFPTAVPAPKCKSWTEKDARLVYEAPFNDLLFRAQTVQSKLADAPPVDPIEFIRIIALARILMPQSHVRLTARRTAMTDEMQALCFFARANSIFAGDTLLIAANPRDDRDSSLLRRLGLTPMALESAE